MRKPPPKIKHPHVFSVSQAETFELCNRKWAFLKMDGLVDPGSAASILGGEVHDQLEGYLERGEPLLADRAGKIAMSAVPYLPPPMYPGMQIEEWFYLRVGDAYYRGLKDVEISEGWRSKNPFVSDHKTTKNFMWAKTAEDLTGGSKGVGNTQAGVYAGHTMHKTGERLVDLQWTYMRTTSSPLAQPTYAIMDASQVARVLERLEETTAKMIATKAAYSRAIDVPPNYRGCSAFGGCPFQDNCGVNEKTVVRSLFSRKRLFDEKEAEAPARKAELRATAERLVPLSRKGAQDVTFEHVRPAAPSRPVARALRAFAKELLQPLSKE